MTNISIASNVVNVLPILCYSFQGTDQVPILLVGNKCDLVHQRQVLSFLLTSLSLSLFVFTSVFWDVSLKL